MQKCDLQLFKTQRKNPTINVFLLSQIKNNLRMVDIHLAHQSQVLNFFQIVLWWRRSWTKSSCSCLHKQVLELDVVYLRRSLIGWIPT